MATFTALNIIPDEHAEDVVDNTKELQIEETVKLYQSALKLHSQRNFPVAASAYISLFKSEIFRYPESFTEFARYEEWPDIEFSDSPHALEIAAAIDAAPSTLSQILYLSYKNHGQFILDCAKNSAKTEPIQKGQLEYQAQFAIDQFARALGSDESDADLWRRAARLGSLLGSHRISRYCLEAAVELDDDPTVAEVEPPSPEEAFAGVQLRDQLKDLSDKVALSHPIMAPFLTKVLPPLLLRLIDPFTFLPRSINDLQPQQDGNLTLQTLSRLTLRSLERTWTALGEALCLAFQSPNGLASNSVMLLLPEVTQSIETEDEPTGQDQAMLDAPPLPSPPVEELEPTVTPSVAPGGGDDTVQVKTTTTTVPLADTPKDSSASNATRKRSQSVAGLQELPDEENGAQKRSKRTRKRDTTEGPVDPMAQFAEQLKVSRQADEDVFAVVGGLLNKIGVTELGSVHDIEQILSNEGSDNFRTGPRDVAVRDLRDILRTWDDEKASVHRNTIAAEILGSATGIANTGLAAFLEQTKAGPIKTSTIPVHSEDRGLTEFVEKINGGHSTLQDIVYDWVAVVLTTYKQTIWTKPLKDAVCSVISWADAEIFERVQSEIERIQASKPDEDFVLLAELTQTLFELHLDIYGKSSGTNSNATKEFRLMAKDRVERWSSSATTVNNLRDSDSIDDLSLRLLWSSVYYATLSDSVSREHKVLCWSELQSLLREANDKRIELPNNLVMPEISVLAAEREVSRLTTMDFFFNLFQADRSDPVAIIETLEPVLDPDYVHEQREGSPEDATVPISEAGNTSSALREMWKFLKTGSISLRLFLWQRLQEAYQSIGYITKVFSCHLKCIEIIVGGITSDVSADLSPQLRHLELLKWLKTLDELLVKSLTIALNDAAECFDIIDERHLKSTCASVALLNRILHSAALFSDEVRVGMSQLPSTATFAPGGSYETFANKLKEMQVRTWSLQYTLVKEAMLQNVALFPALYEDQANFLTHVHYMLGLRHFCKVSNKIFLKMMKVEVMRLKHLEVEKWADYLGQVLFDLYGLNLGVGTYLIEDHGCPPETLERRTAVSILDKVIALANNIPMKDLLKHELRSTIEKLQTAVGQATETPQMVHNKRNYQEYLKSSIRPTDFAKAWKGKLMLDQVPVPPEDSKIARQGWYLLLGMINLSKFRSQKRLSSGSPTDDLQVAASFFRLDLQFGLDEWESWYRLAQYYDLELAEAVQWSSETINNNRSEIVRLERSSIHCYLMAMTTSIQSADESTHNLEMLADMYFDFGMRLYASSRPPFTMEAFYMDGIEKHMSGPQHEMYKAQLHPEVERYPLWSYASALFKKALRQKPNSWLTHYMLGKCLYKMFRLAQADPALAHLRQSTDVVLQPFLRAVETCPAPRDGRQEPILEPHYKLVSIVNKLILFGDLQPQAGADLLQQQKYAINKGETIAITSNEGWNEFILGHLRVLRTVDKQHWQHRMVARVASILFDKNEPDYHQALAARNEFQTSVFTKTMQVVVWRPDHERSGRHHVFMSNYVSQMVTILWYCNDIDNVELLTKKIRKKSSEFFRFEHVWNECCSIYLRLIRRKYEIPATMDEMFRSVPAEEYEVIRDRVSVYMSSANASHPAASALREAEELKKLNNNLMKSTPIDDLINDSYGLLYVHVRNTTGPIPPAAPSQFDGEAVGPSMAGRVSGGPMSLDHLVMDMNGTQIPVPVTIVSTDANRPRKVGVSRREVLRHAELLATRPEPSRTTAPSRSLPDPLSILGSNAGTSGDQGSVSGAASTPKADEGADDEQEGEEEGDEDGGEEGANIESESGHAIEIAEDADDESGSDLSDVPEMEDVDEDMIFND